MGIDQELADAVAQSEAQSRRLAVPNTRASAAAPKPQLGLLIGSLGLAGAILFWVFVVPQSPRPLSVSIDSLLHDRARYTGQLVRVRGTLVAGTLVQGGTPCRTRFDLRDRATQLHVNFHECAVPDTLRDSPYLRPQVIAEGELQADGHLEAQELLGLGGGKYEMRQRPLTVEEVKASSAVKTFPTDQ